MERPKQPAATPDRPPGPGDDPRHLASVIGSQLRRLRRSRGLSLRDLSVATGVSHGMLDQIELGKNSPSIKTLAKIAQGLGVRLVALLDPDVGERDPER